MIKAGASSSAVEYTQAGGRGNAIPAPIYTAVKQHREKNAMEEGKGALSGQMFGKH